MKPTWQSDDGTVQLYLGDCLDVMPHIGKVDAVVTDPPYHKAKREWWDRQWDDSEKFLSWVAAQVDEWHRILAPNGSLYCFASPAMSARVECVIAERFNVLNRIRWNKGAGWHRKAKKEVLRSYLAPHEEILFAEHYGADSNALGLSGYQAKCDELRGFVFEPLRSYLEGERKRAGIKRADCNAACGFSRNPGGMAARHYFGQSQWQLPTAEHYLSLQRLFNAGCSGEEPQHLRREYEDLRREYEDLRRPFSVTADVPFTDTWDFAPVQAYPGKHPCEKPLAMMEHILRSSTKENGCVLDPFMGSGTTGVACVRTGRKFIGIEIEPKYFEIAAKRIKKALNDAPLFDKLKAKQGTLI